MVFCCYVESVYSMILIYSLIFVIRELNLLMVIRLFMKIGNLGPQIVLQIPKSLVFLFIIHLPFIER